MSKKKTQEEFEKEVFDLEGNNYSVLETYKGANTKIKMKHNTCGYEYEVKPSVFLRGRRCPKCAIQNVSEQKKKTQEEFETEVFDLVGEEYAILGKYKKNKVKVKIRHNCEKCNNYEFEMRPNDFLNGQRCPICNILKAADRYRKTQEEFEKEFFNLVANEYTLLENYKGDKVKIKIRHNCEKCNNYEYEVRPNSFFSGNRCPKCRESKGEKAIYDFLEKSGVSFKREYRSFECKNIKPLPFDFAIFDSKENIKLLIEYQGEQHYKKFDYFFKEDKDFVNRIITDCKKRAYCEYNNIPLLEISYTDFDKIEDILSNAIHP